MIRNTNKSQILGCLLWNFFLELTITPKKQLMYVSTSPSSFRLIPH